MQEQQKSSTSSLRCNWRGPHFSAKNCATTLGTDKSTIRAPSFWRTPDNVCKTFDLTKAVPFLSRAWALSASRCFFHRFISRCNSLFQASACSAETAHPICSLSCLKKGVPGSSFLTIFAAHAFVHGFFIDFPSILAWKSVFFRMWFLFSSRCFLIVATLTIVWFLQYESYFFMFRVFSFFRQKSRKIDAKTRSQQIIKKWW